MSAAHDCSFPEIEIGPTPPDEEDDEYLKAGMRVLLPCSFCGDPARDYMEMIEQHNEDLNAAILEMKPDRPLYHWAPKARRKQIIRHGLRPYLRTTTTTANPRGEERNNPLCFADTPSWAWALSGDMTWTPSGEWDLWLTYLDRIEDPIVLATDERPSGMYEVRTVHRVYKRDLWLVGTRKK